MKDSASEQSLATPKSNEKLRKVSLGTAIALVNIIFMIACEFQIHAVKATEVLAYIDTNTNGRYDYTDQTLPDVYFEFDVGEDPHKGFTTDENGLIVLPIIINDFSIKLDPVVINNQSRDVSNVTLKNTTDGRTAKIEVGYSANATTPEPSR